MAAHRFGITTIILPKDNEKDLIEVPEEVRDVLDINLVETIDEVLALRARRCVPDGCRGGRRSENASALVNGSPSQGVQTIAE